jgi:hypothetical protein
MKSKTKLTLQLVAGFVGYGVGVLLVNRLYNDHSPYRYGLVLLPVLPVLWLAAVTVRAVSELDELKRKIAVEAMAFSGIATGLTCFSYLFIHDMGAPEFHAEWAFYLMWAYYGLGRMLSGWRYR